MKIVVCVKQVRSLSEEIVLIDGSIDPACLQRELNEWDIFAVEQALLIRDQQEGAQVIVLTAGGPETEAVLRRGLAMGAQKAIRVDCEQPEVPDPIATARILASVLAEEKPDLIVCGAQSSDGADASVGAALASLMHMPWIVVVKKLDVDGSTLVAQRELESGRLQEIAAKLPALITVQSGINQPRYATLRSIKQAERMAIECRYAPEVARSRRIRSILRPEKHGEVNPLGADPRRVAKRIVEIVRQNG